jgi:predicted metal-binding membrane protein
MRTTEIATGTGLRSNRNAHSSLYCHNTTVSAEDQMSRISASESAARKERFILIVALIVLAGAAWIYTAHLAWEMNHMDAAPAMFMPHAGPWSLTEFFMLFVMWAVMMTGMMLPSVAPMLLMVAATGQRHQKDKRPFRTAALFLSGYLLVWFVFSALC